MKLDLRYMYRSKVFLWEIKQTVYKMIAISFSIISSFDYVCYMLFWISLVVKLLQLRRLIISMYLKVIKLCVYDFTYVREVLDVDLNLSLTVCIIKSFNWSTWTKPSLDTWISLIVISWFAKNSFLSFA